MSADERGGRDTAFSTGMTNEILDENTFDGSPEVLEADYSQIQKSNKKGRAVRVWLCAERATRAIASVGVVVAAFAALLQYWEANEEQRSKRSLDIVKEWQTLEIDEDFAAVQRFVEPRLAPVFSSLEMLDEAAQQIALKNLARTWLEEARLASPPATIEKNVDNIILFFSQMEICIDAELCEGDVLQRYFYSEVSSFWGYFSAYADMRREAGYQEYGSAVDRLARRFEDVTQ